MKPATETKIIRALQFGCVAMVLAMALNAPSPNGKGGWRDQFVEGWRQAQANDQPATDTIPPAAPETGGDQ